jgi:hypothetical protein
LQQQSALNNTKPSHMDSLLDNSSLSVRVLPCAARSITHLAAAYLCMHVSPQKLCMHVHACVTTGAPTCVSHLCMHVSLQVHQQELGAQIRLPPLNPKATAPLKHLAAGMGALFAGPVDDAALLLQWSASSSGSTLPMGGSAYRKEDHDSAAAAALGLGHLPGIGSSSSSSSSKSRDSCLAFGPVPGRLWSGCADGRVHCWEVGGDGAAARLLHSWEAHSGKIKGIALSPCGRLFTGVQGQVVEWLTVSFTKVGDLDAGLLGRPPSYVLACLLECCDSVIARTCECTTKRCHPCWEHRPGLCCVAHHACRIQAPSHALLSMHVRPYIYIYIRPLLDVRPGTLLYHIGTYDVPCCMYIPGLMYVPGYVTIVRSWRR